MIYRNNAVIYSPKYAPMKPGEPIQETGEYTSQKFSSINAAKREVREKRLTARRGKPPKGVQS